MNTLSDTLKGALLMMAAMAGFTINDAFMRDVLADLPLFQSIFLRGAFLSLFLALIAARRGVLFKRMEKRDRRWTYIRSACELFGTFAFLTALTLMPFANIAAIMQVLPLSVTLAAAVFLGAPVGWRRITAIILGFVGVIVIIRPGTDGFSSASFLVLFAVALVTLRDIAARILSVGLPSVTVALNAALMLMVVNGGLMVNEGWTSVSLENWLFLIAAAIVLTIGYLSSVAAMRVGDIASIAPFRYTGLIFAIIIGYFAFNEVPDAPTMIGSAIIIAMGIFTFYRENRLSKTN